MSLSTTYLLNVALHAVVLSTFACLVLLVMREAKHRSVAAITGLLAVGFLPWFSALRPTPPVTAPVPEIQTPSPVLPTWTVAIVPAKVEHPTSAGPSVELAEFVLPDPLTSFITIWAAGCCIGLTVLGIALLKVRSWRKSLQLPDDATWQLLQALAPEIPKCGHFRINESTASPCVTGFWQPKIVIPGFLLEKGSEEGLRWAVRHEVSHWQAGDSRWMIVFAIIRSVNWWNPLVHQLISRWTNAREQLCDLHATGVSASRADYGKFLITMAGKISRQPPLAVAMAKRLHTIRLKRRIVSLLAAETGSESPVGKSFIGAGSVAFIGCAVLVSILKIGAEEPVLGSGIAVESEAAGKRAGNKFPSEPTSIPPPPEDPLASFLENPAPPPVAVKPVGQLKFTTKFVMTATQPATKDGAVLADAGIQFIMRTLSQTKGVDLMTAPSVTAKFGQTATVEIIREVPGTPEQIATRGPKSAIPFTGVRLGISADLVDDQVNLKFDPEYHFISGLDLSLVNIGDIPPAGTDPEKIKIAKRAVTARLSAGQTLCTDLGEIEPGKFLQVFTTVEPIDATGRPLNSFKNGNLLAPDEKQNQPATNANQMDKPLTEVQGRLRLSAELVDIPRKSNRSTVPVRMALSVLQAAEAIRNTPGAKVVKLAVAEIPLNQRRTPWREYPEVCVSAIASKDYKLITISDCADWDEKSEFPGYYSELPSGSTMNFGIKSNDPKIERRMLVKIEAIK